MRRPHLYELCVGASWEDLVPLKERPNIRQIHIIYLQYHTAFRLDNSYLQVHFIYLQVQHCLQTCKSIHAVQCGRLVRKILSTPSSHRLALQR